MFLNLPIFAKNGRHFVYHRNKGGLARVEKNHDFFLNKKNWIFLNLNWIFFIYLKSGIHVIKYFTIRLSGVNTATQVCALCAFVLKKHTKLC